MEISHIPTENYTPLVGNKEQLSEKNMEMYDVLERIYETADNQRNYLVAKRKYTRTESEVDDVTKTIGVEKSDFPTPSEITKPGC